MLIWDSNFCLNPNALACRLRVTLKLVELQRVEELGFGLRSGSVPAGRVNAADAHGLTLRAELETEHSCQRQRKPGRCELACLSFPHL